MTIQSQIEAAHAAGGGDVVLPVGRQILNSQIVVKAGVRLIGSGKVAYNYHLNGIELGTILDVQWGSGSGSCGDVTKAAIVMEGGTSLLNIGFDYSLQDMNAPAPVEYGSTVQPNDPVRNEYNITIEGNYFMKSYMAIDCRVSKGAHAFSNLTIADNNGAPIYCAIALDGQSDWGIIRDCNFNVGFANLANHTTGVVPWSASNANLIILGGNDWVQMIDCQFFGGRCGVQLNGGVGYTGEGPYLFQNCQFDALWHTIEVNGPILHPIRVLGCTFAPFNFVNGAQGCAFTANPGSTVAGLQFMDNYVFGPCLFMVYMTGGTFSDVICQGNIGRVSGSGGPAFYVNDTKKVQLFNNIVEGFALPFNIGNSTAVLTGAIQT